jgi:16S rRNA (cytosine967-C5)-methyltransferase
LDGLEDLSLNIPVWLLETWKKEYGKTTVEKMIPVLLSQPPLDISVHGNPELWAEKWQGQVLPTGSVRVAVSSPLALNGFQQNCCWVQGASASVPAQLFSDVKGKKVLDMCAAPGGKTAQLVCRGAWVTAVDISENRLKRLTENMKRLGLSDKVSVRISDALALDEKELYDAILLDAPCSATGTISHHPEVMFRQTQQDILRLSELQKQMLLKAIRLVKSGGEIVFSTCSLQPEEGDAIVRSVSDYVQVIRPIQERWQPFLTEFGSLRFLPSQGYDGFYACIMCKN